MLQVSDNALQQVENFKYLRVVFTSDGRPNNELDARISVAGALSFCGHKTGAFKHCQAISFQTGLCFDPHLWS